MVKVVMYLCLRGGFLNKSEIAKTDGYDGALAM
jgi:hypothetical protein